MSIYKKAASTIIANLCRRAILNRTNFTWSYLNPIFLPTATFLLTHTCVCDVCMYICKFVNSNSFCRSELDTLNLPYMTQTWLSYGWVCLLVLKLSTICICWICLGHYCREEISCKKSVARRKKCCCPFNLMSHVVESRIPNATVKKCRNAKEKLSTSSIAKIYRPYYNVWCNHRCRHTLLLTSDAPAFLRSFSISSWCILTAISRGVFW